MNKNIEKLALDAGLLNYIDNETPRRYFVHGHADLAEIEEFAEALLEDAIVVMTEHDYHGEWLGEKLKEHYGIPYKNFNLGDK